MPSLSGIEKDDTTKILEGTKTDLDVLKAQADLAERAYLKHKKEYDALNSRYRNLRYTNIPAVAEGRLTIQSGVPFPLITNNTGLVSQRTIYYTPYVGNRISVYRSNNTWRIFTFGELQYDVRAAGGGGNPNTNFDIWVYQSAPNTLTLEATPWLSDTSRTALLTLQDGVLVRNADKTRRYLGSIRSRGGANQTVDWQSTLKGIWNYYNRIPIVSYMFDASNTWNDGNNGWRETQASNNIYKNQFVIGISETPVMSVVKSNVGAPKTTSREGMVGVGANDSTTNYADLLGSVGPLTARPYIQTWAEYLGYPGQGWNNFHWIENSPSGANVTFMGDDGDSTTSNVFRSGIMTVHDG